MIIFKEPYQTYISWGLTVVVIFTMIGAAYVANDSRQEYVKTQELLKELGCYGLTESDSHSFKEGLPAGVLLNASWNETPSDGAGVRGR